MSALAFAVLSVNVGLALAAQPPNQNVVIDGKLDDTFWQQVRADKLAPIEAGVPSAMGGTVRAVIAGGYLYLGAELPEPGGRVTARSVGFDPVWEGGGEARSETSQRRYTFGAPEGEDYVRFIIRVYNENDWMVQVGPLGGYAVKWRWTEENDWFASLPYKCDRFLVAAAVDKDGWGVEAAIPLEQIGSPRPGYLQVIAERNRAARPGTPEEGWIYPFSQTTSPVPVIPASKLSLSTPVLHPHELGNSEPPLEVGYKKDLPAIYARWDDPDWVNVPVWTLRRNEPLAQLPKFPTEVKLMHDGQTMAILARCIEPGAVIAHANRRDGLVTQDDSFQVYLATSGSSYVQYAVNPTGYVLDAAGHQGSSRLSYPYVNWNSPVHAAGWKQGGEWLARLDLPLTAIADVLETVGTRRQWKILLVRHRVARDGEPAETSVLPVTQGTTPFCPARYRRLELVEAPPSQLPKPALPSDGDRDLTILPSQVFSPEQRKQLDLAGMLDGNVRGKMMKMLEAEEQDWNRVKTVSDWEQFRDVRLKALKSSLGKFPASTPLELRVTSEFQGEGYRRENIVYQSQPGLWVTANLYLPSPPRPQMPAFVLVHSLHGPKTQFELQDMGIIWARAGCAVLSMDQVGYGERIQNYPWDREEVNSRYIMGEQLYLVGTNLMTWMVWDIERGIDVLWQRQDVNKKEIVLLGAVAGGGDPAAVTAALDPRVSGVVPFNFGEVRGATGAFDPMRVLRLSIVDQFLPWFICASVAPRYMVHAREISWSEGQQGTFANGIGEMGLGHEQNPAWIRFQKVWGLYDSIDHLGEAHGYGPFPGPGECWNIGPSQRISLYPTLERWFGIPLPFAGMKASEYANLQREPITDRRPVEDLAVLTPAIASELRMRNLHEIAYVEGEAEVKAAREKLSNISAEQRRDWLQSEWAKKLGDIEPRPHPEGPLLWTKRLPFAVAEALSIETEPGIDVPLLLLLPQRYEPYPSPVPMPAVPVVVGLSEGGKGLFLATRSDPIVKMLKAGIAVCLPDVRGTGETSPDSKRDPQSREVYLASSELMLGDTLLGKRLKDLRTVLSYLEGRHDLDSQRMGLWGDSFAPPNPAHLLIEEQLQWQIGPEIEQQAEPLGGLLAILGALYDGHVRAVAVHGGLVSYLSMMTDSFVYVPEDVVVPDILQIGDIADLASGLAPRPLALEGLVDGHDSLVAGPTLHRELEPLEAMYRNTPSFFSVEATEGRSDFAEWFHAHLE